MQTAGMDIRRAAFMLRIPDDWPRDSMQIATRLRGQLGFTLKHISCFLDAATDLCPGCTFREQCHYGLSFETPGPVDIPGFGRVGNLPHAWAMRVDQAGMELRCELVFLGSECGNLEAWRQAVQAMPLDTIWLPEPSHAEAVTLRWRSLSPARLRLGEKNPNAEDATEALSASVARKCRMLAALHGIKAPASRLPVPHCEQAIWVDGERYSHRKKEKQPMGGWMMQIRWPDDTPAEWLAWFRVVLLLGIGRQTTFGFGRFISIAD